MIMCEYCGEEYHEQYERTSMWDISHSPLCCRASESYIELPGFADTALQRHEVDDV